eukprot:TRINITY_DN3069_c0_g1_i3.p1 TRINITY_DN3069_c0_g1~~TRINITY_DN3069_c0_g1_i3.p1  ORF type:complete len:492 (-),score=-9.19 TRINITY_DN3069_c0_g1_i3:201-1676(-)
MEKAPVATGFSTPSAKHPVFIHGVIAGAQGVGETHRLKSLVEHLGLNEALKALQAVPLGIHNWYNRPNEERAGLVETSESSTRGPPQARIHLYYWLFACVIGLTLLSIVFAPKSLAYQRPIFRWEPLGAQANDNGSLPILKGEYHGVVCSETCCVIPREPPLRYHDGSLSDPYEAHDLMSPINAKRFAELHYGNLPRPQESLVGDFQEALIPCLQDGTILFVDTEQMQEFIEHQLPTIRAKIILMSGDSDLSNPGELNADLVDSVINSPFIIHWYAMNCDRIPNETHFSCFPNGLNQWDTFGKSYKALHAALERHKNKTVDSNAPKVTLLVNFLHDDLSRVDHARRDELWKYLCDPEVGNPELRNLSYCHYDPAMGVDEYVSLVTNSKFVVSPSGNGLDGYRNYETLYMGSIPIVLSTALDQLFEKLPMLIVDNWTSLSPTFLNEAYDRISNTVWDMRPLYFKYWNDQFMAHRGHGFRYEYHLRVPNLKGP